MGTVIVHILPAEFLDRRGIMNLSKVLEWESERGKIQMQVVKLYSLLSQPVSQPQLFTEGDRPIFPY
jgi:hypothetical protein